MSKTRFPSRFGKYILLDRLASGGMAEVYRAKVTGVEDFQRLVAIKCMLPQMFEDANFTAMFIDEAKLASQLNHANIVQIYELGRVAERLYIAMELVNGRDLRHVLRTAAASKTPLPPGFAAYVISKAAEGLDYAHRKAGVDGKALKIVHRDVSPQNILISFDGEVKVVDFGIAKATVRMTETQAGVLKGKFAYMSPEQVLGNDVDRRADIFALGTVLFEIATGTRLFGGENDLSVLEKVRNADVPNIKKILPDCPDELANVLKRSLTKNPDNRYGWASEMAENLESLLIDDRSIFGTKRASQFMRALYADEISALQDHMKRFAGITEADCQDPAGARPTAPQENLVFKTAFAGEKTQADGPDTDVVEETTGVMQMIPESEATSHDNAQRSPPVPPKTGPQKIEVSTTAPILAPRKAKRSVWLPVTLAALAITFASVAYVQWTRQSLLPKPPEPPAVQVPGPISAPKPTPLPQPAPMQVVTPVPVVKPKDTETLQVQPVVQESGRIVVTPVESRRETVTLTPRENPSLTLKERPGDKPKSEKQEAVQPPTDAAAPEPAPSEAPEAKAEEETPERPKGPAFGFVSVRATGVRSAKVFIDGHEVGYLPLVFHRLKAGKHAVRVVEYEDGTPAREKTLNITVTAKDTRRSPQKIVVPL